MRLRNTILWLCVGLSWAARAGAEERKAPVGELNPTVATKRLLQHLADDSWPLERFVDRARGLILIVVYGGESDPPPPPRAVRLCGAELERELASLKKLLRDQLRAAAEDDKLACQNGAAPHCTFAPAGEYAATSTLLFARDAARGLFIEAYTVVPAVEWGPSAKRTRAFVAKKLAALRTSACPDAARGDGR